MEHIDYGTGVNLQQALLEPLIVGSIAVTARALSGAAPDLTLLQWRALVVIHESAEGATVGDIAARIGANSSPVSRLVGRLEHRGLVRTQPDTDDRRSTRVLLTQLGMAVVERVIATRLEMVKDISVRDLDRDTLERLALGFGQLAR